MSQESRLRGRAYTPGFTDALGDRFLARGSADEPVLEVLKFRPELSGSTDFDKALRARVDVVQAVKHPSIASVYGVERPDGLGLCLVSEHIEGRRLSEFAPASLGPAFVTELIRTVTPVLCVLNQAGVGVAHGALSADRIVVAADGRLVVVEHVMGWAIESLRFSRKRLNDLGIVVGASEPPRFDSRIDVVQLGFLALSLLLRRRLDPADCPARVPALLIESADDGSPMVPAEMREWLERALQCGPKPFASAHEAVDALDELELDDEPEVLVDEANALLEFPDETDGSPAPPSTKSPRETAPVNVADPPVAPVQAPAVRAVPVVVAVPAAVAAPVAVALPAAVAEPAAVAAPTAPAVPAPSRVRATEPLAPSVAPTAAASSGRGFTKVAGWILGAVSLVAVGYAIAIVFVWYDQGPATVSRVTSPPAETAAVDTEPPPAAANAGNQPAPAEPARPPARTTSSPSANRSAAPVVRPGATGASGAGRTAALTRFGSVTMTSAIALQVLLEGRLVGTSGQSITLPEGTHRLEVVNDSLEFRQAQVVRIESGRPASVQVALPTGRISLNATPWAEVTINGAVVGQTPIANYSLTIGTHEIVFRHPQLGMRRQTVLVKPGATVRVTEAFQR